MAIDDAEVRPAGVRSIPAAAVTDRSRPRSPRPGDWLVVGAAVAAQLVTFGAVYAFGVVLDDVERDLGGATTGVTLIPAVAAFVLFFVGPLTGRLGDASGPHRVVLAAALLLPSGLLLTSTASHVWLAVLGFGVLGGAAAGCVYVPVVAHIVARPTARSSLHAGIVVAGVTLGPAISSPILRALVDAHGWRTVYRLYAVFAGAALLAVSMVLARTARHVGGGAGIGAGVAERPRWWPSIRRLARSSRFLRLYAAVLVIAPSLYVPLMFLPSYAKGRGLTSGTGAALVTTVGVASAAGRVGLAALARRLPALVIFRGCFALLAASSVLWAAAGSNRLGLVVSAFIAGTGYGGVAGIAPSIVAADGTAQLGTTLGVLYTALGIGGLVTGPAVGVVVDHAGYRPALVALAGLAIAGLLLVPGRGANRSAPGGPKRSAPTFGSRGVPGGPDARDPRPADGGLR